MVVVCLVEEDILAVTSRSLRGKVLECAILCDTMLAAEVLPEVRADLVTA